MALNQRIDQLRLISKGPRPEPRPYVFVILEPNKGEVLGVFDDQSKAETLLDSLWDFHSEFYCPDAYMVSIKLNEDLLGILPK